ncbi:RagB/SusD family nutrient uptake outer membrane protein [Segetibacter sp. 3557_3]|uniref:RagB/SusD family nutrient uptake outer membrane protein n=1 Tax=Segetibacter sp. 3557_3 TaxID=2547429 RepID=UPI00140527ED|nr:RagB/SusD family nutrient uptake outer membrane protein [Segetibacter sp. 3557_3]
MKFSKYKILSVTAAFLLGGALLSSCKKDFFEVADPNGFEVEGSFEDVGAVGLFLNRTYALVMPGWPTLGGIHNTSDELNNASTAWLYGQLTENSVTDIGTSGTSLTANRYADIRRCNQAIDGLNASTRLTEDVKRPLKGQFFFLRAYTYFKLVRLYGGVPLIFHPQTPDQELQVPRSKTSECIAAIASDLDSATAYLPKAWAGNADIGRVTRAAASAVKAKTLLYWASPQFNPSNIASRWTAAYEANKVAYDMCVADGYVLLSSYANIFLTEDHKEILLVRKYQASKDQGQNVENVTRPASESTAGGGSNQPTWNLVQAYPMANGLAPTDAGSNYDPVHFWLNRDPRFAASISYNGDVWPLSGKAGRKQWSYIGITDEGSINTGFYLKRFINPSLTPAQAVYNSNTGGGNGMDWIELRLAEVILNLAECANETGNLAEAKSMVRLIRVRAGIVAGAFDYGLAPATNQAAMRSLILRERQVEFALEGARNFDLRRTRNLGLITARESYRVPTKPPYYPGTTRTGALPTDIFLERTDAFGIKLRDTIAINTPANYDRVFGPGVIASLEGANNIILPDRYYVYPLPTLFTQTPAIAQTNGWAGGTFDPYQ